MIYVRLNVYVVYILQNFTNPQHSDVIYDSGHMIGVSSCSVLKDNIVSIGKLRILKAVK